MNISNVGNRVEQAARTADRVATTLKNVKTICLVLVVLAMVAAASVIVVKLLNLFNKKKNFPIRNVKDTVLAAIALVGLIAMILIPTANFIKFDVDESLFADELGVEEDLTGFSGWGLIFGKTNTIFAISAYADSLGAEGALTVLLIIVMLLTAATLCLAFAGIANVVTKYFDLETPFYKTGKKALSKCLTFGIFYFTLCLLLYVSIASAMDTSEFIILAGYIVPIIAIVLKIGYSCVNNMIPEDLVFVEPKDAPVVAAEETAPVVTEAPAAPATNEDTLAELKHYKELLDNGLISEEDYESKKTEYLNSIASK